MTPLGRFSLRLAIYGAVIAYLASDLFVFRGPLRQRIERANPRSAEAIAAAKAGGVVARVFNHRITRSQLERAVHERLWLEGKSPAAVAPENLKTLRYAALADLIDHELLRVKAKANATQLVVSDEEVNERLRRMLGRFVTKGEMETALKSQGIAGEQALRDRLAARIQQEKYVESRIGPLAAVSENEAREWFEQNRAGLALPERAEVRHIFLPTLDHPPEQARETLQAALDGIKAGRRDFASLAAEISEDPASKDRGGELGWMTRARLPEDFAAAVFSLPLNQASLLRTRIGWHIVEVTARKPAETRAFDDCRDEVIAALQAVKRRQAADDFRAALRQQEADKIDIHHDMLAE